jgi:hypothetical protein
MQILITRKEALLMNNTLVGINDTLYLKGKAFGLLVGDCYKARNYSLLKQGRVEFEQFIDASRARVAKMKDVGGSEALRYCEIELLDVEKKMVIKDFTPFEELTETSTREQVMHQFDLVQDDSKEEAALLNKLKTCQAEYAKKNGFTLVKAKQ